MPSISLTTTAAKIVQCRVGCARPSDKYGIRRRYALLVTVYTEVYTDIENSGHLGP